VRNVGRVTRRATARATEADFNGRWVVVSPREGAGQEQVVTVDEKSLTKARPDGSRKMVYQLDGVERRMPLPGGGTRMASDITIMAAAKWDGNRIVITTITNYSAGMRTEGQRRLVDRRTGPAS
jgi:hypothetical protein